MPTRKERGSSGCQGHHSGGSALAKQRAIEREREREREREASHGTQPGAQTCEQVVDCQRLQLSADEPEVVVKKMENEAREGLGIPA